MTIKQTGSIQLGKSAEALAPVNLDVTNFLKTRLLITANSGGELSLFQIYVNAYPNEVAVDELMKQTGLMTTSINVYRRKLKARRLIDGNQAKAALFD